MPGDRARRRHAHCAWRRSTSTARPSRTTRIDGGFFKTAGLRVEFQQFNNGQAIAGAVAGGALDIAISNIVAMTQAHAKNVPFVIVAPGAVYLASDADDA